MPVANFKAYLCKIKAGIAQEALFLRARALFLKPYSRYKRARVLHGADGA